MTHGEMKRGHNLPFSDPPKPPDRRHRSSVIGFPAYKTESDWVKCWLKPSFSTSKVMIALIFVCDLVCRTKCLHVWGSKVDFSVGIVKNICQEPLSGDIVDDIIMFKVKVGQLETTLNKNKCRRERGRIISIMFPEKIKWPITHSHLILLVMRTVNQIYSLKVWCEIWIWKKK